MSSADDKTKEAVKILKKIEKERQEKSLLPICETDERETGDIPTEGKCVVCPGRIMERKIRKYNPEAGLPVDGPGSARQHTIESVGYHCESCGLRYMFVPKTKE